MSNLFRLPKLRIADLEEPQIDEAAAFLHQSWHGAYSRHLPRSLLAQRPTSHFRTHLAEYVHDCRLAWMGDRLAGLASSCANGIEDLWVHRRYRRRGIAGGLIDSLVANLKQRGFRYVQVGCEDFNSDAIAFFEAQGWRRIGAEKLAIAPGRRIEARVYCCSLSEDGRAEFLV